MRLWSILSRSYLRLDAHPPQIPQDTVRLDPLEPRVLLSANVSWTPLNEPGVGGQVTSLSVSPFDSNRILVGGDMLGIGLSTDGGDTWNETAGLKGGGQTVEQFTWVDADTVWAGTARGPYKSDDGGLTWTSKRSGFPSFVGLGFTAPVQKILIDPNNSSRVLAFIGNFRRFNSNNGYTDLGEVWESTDGGENWAQKSTIAAGKHIEQAVYKDNNTIYAIADGKFYRSSDDGSTWGQFGTGLVGSAKWVTKSPTSNSTVWVSTTDGIYKSTDSGANFTKTSSGLPTSGDFRVVEVDQENDGRDVLYANVLDNGTNRAIYVSTNGGTSWTKGSTSYPGNAYFNGSPKVLTIDPNDSDRMFFGSNESIYRTANATSSWVVTSNESSGNGFFTGNGYSGLVAEDFVFNPFDPNESALAALDSGKWFSTDDLQTWKFAKSGYNQGVDRFNGAQTVAFTDTSGANQVIYLASGQFNGNTKLNKTINGGASWTTQSLPSGTTSDIRGLHANFNSGQTNQVWIVRKDSSGNGDVYRSNSSGDSGTWTEVGANIGNAQIITTDFSASNGATFYVGADGGVFKTTDGTNFTKVGAGGPNDVLEITIDPNDSTVLWVADDDTGLWRWNGSSWSQRATSNKIRDVAVDPTDSNRVFYATDEDPFKSNTGESGVWMSETGGGSGSFTQVNQGLRNLRVQTLAFKPGTSTLIAGTNGSGYYRADVGAVYQQASDANNLVSIEAENFDANVGGATDAWTKETGGSGGFHLNSGPDNGNTFNSNYTTSSPRVSYEVNFTQTGTHYVWIRGKAGGSSTGASDSLHVGLDGAAVSTADRITGFNSSFGWKSATMDSGSRATINVTTAGVHTVDVYMREDGFDFDKIVLTTSSSYTPSGNGPAQSERSQPVTTLVDDNFNGTANGAIPTGWARDTGGGSVGVVEFPSVSNKSLRLHDTKNFDGTSATRTFTPANGVVTTEFRFRQSDQDNWTRLQLRSGGTTAIDLRTSGGNIAIEGSSGTTNLLNYASNTWYDIKIVADTNAGTFDVFINDILEASNVAFKNSVTSIDRFHINTGTGAVTNVWIDDLTITA